MIQHQKVIVRKQEEAFDREVEGLIEMCKYLAGASEAEKSIVKYMEFNPHVVVEARRRVFRRGFKKVS